MHGHLWVIGAGLHAQVTPGLLGIEVVTQKGRQLRERGGTPRGDSEAVLSARRLEQRGPEAERESESARSQPQRLAGVIRRSLRRPADRAGRTHFKSQCHARRGIRPILEQRDEVISIGTVDHIECRKVHVILDSRRDAGLVSAEEVIRRRLGILPLTTCGRSAGSGTGTSADHEPGRSHARCEPEEPSSAEPRRRADGLGGR